MLGVAAVGGRVGSTPRSSGPGSDGTQDVGGQSVGDHAHHGLQDPGAVALVGLHQDGPGRDAHPDEEGGLRRQALQGLAGGFGPGKRRQQVEGAGSSGRIAGTIHRAAGACDRFASSLPATPITSAASSVRAGRLRSADSGVRPRASTTATPPRVAADPSARRGTPRRQA
jgi:hypothetical protein